MAPVEGIALPLPPPASLPSLSILTFRHPPVIARQIMSDYGIALDKAELLSTVLEAFLYGFSLLMFGGTIWVLLYRRSTHQVNRKMVMAACSLLLFSTAHFVIDIIRIIQGLILSRDTPTGPSEYFADVSQWTFVSKNYIYNIQTLIGDGVMLYRCYAVWQSKTIMVLPALLWCAVAATGIGAPYTLSHARQSEVFGGTLSRWITAFYASTFTTNLVATILLAYRIWYIDQRTAKLRGHRESHLRAVLHIVIDAGAIYSFTLLAALICFVNESNGQYVVLDMITPIISITFYMVIIRVGLTNRASQRMRAFSQDYPSSGHNSSADGTSRMQFHITTLTDSENKVDSGCLSMSPMIAAPGSQNRPREVKIHDDVEEVPV